MLPNRVLAGLLAVATVALAVSGEALVLTHTAGAVGLIMLAAGAATGIAGWVVLGTPRRRGDIRV